jgi:hypothetical protein
MKQKPLTPMSSTEALRGMPATPAPPDPWNELKSARTLLQTERRRSAQVIDALSRYNASLERQVATLTSVIKDLGPLTPSELHRPARKGSL